MSIITNKLKQRMQGGRPEYNKSTIFLLPMLAECKGFLNTENRKLLVNIYYHTEEDLNYNKSFKNRIYCVFKNTPEFNSDSNLNKLKQSSNYIGINRIDNYVIIIFKVPYTYLGDYLLFKKGKYSKISDKYKKILLDYYPSFKDYLKNILYPSDIDKKQLSLFLGTKENITEVYSTPNPTDEIFRLSSFWNIKM